MRAFFANDAERKEERRRRLEQFAAVQQSETPPIELQQPRPRHIRWGPVAKRLLALELLLVLVVIAVVSVFAIWFACVAAREHQKLRHLQDQLRQQIQSAENAGQIHKLGEKQQALDQTEKDLRKTESDLARKTPTMLGALLILLIFYVGFWIAMVGPFALLLRHGMYARGRVTGRTRKSAKCWTVDYTFLTEAGENIHVRWNTSKAVHDIIKDGQEVWVLYLPRKPKRAAIYGLAGVAEVVAM